MEVPGRGAEAAMAQEGLDGPQVGAVLEQMGGEAMSQGMNSHVLVQAAALTCGPAGAVHGPGGEGLIGPGSGEEIITGPDRLPILAQDLQQPRREPDEAILLPLGLADAKDHPLA